MSYTLIDYTKGFHELCKRRDLSAGARSVFAAIIGEFNAAHFPERLRLTDRVLKDFAGLKSLASVHECKLVLKNHKLIDYTGKKNGKGITEYSLPDTWLENLLPNSNRTNAEQLPNISRTTEAASYQRVRGDVLDVETKDESSAGVRKGGDKCGKYVLPDTSQDVDWEKYL